MTIVSMGELLIDFVAVESGVPVGLVNSFVKAAGGAPANVAVAAARLGNQAAFLGMVGDDPFGHFLAETLAIEGVDVRGLKFTKKARTMLAFVSLAAEGERSFSFYRHPSADMKMKPQDVDFAVIDAAKVFHFGSITLINQPARSATLAAADRARERDLLISYDPNLRLNLWSSKSAARKGMLRGFEYAHIVKISDDEVEFLTGGSDPAPLWRDHTKAIVVTHGSRGSTVHLRKHTLTVDGQAVNAVDTTGAGDAFVAGMLHGVLARAANPSLFDELTQWGEILHFANTVGALTTTRRGAIPSLPSRAEVEVLLSSVG